MSKGIVIGIAVLAILGVGSFFVFSNDSSNESMSTSSDSHTNSNTSAENTNPVKGTFAELLTLGQNYTCTFDHADVAGNKTAGTVYVAASGDKLRGDFTLTPVEGAPYDIGVIRDTDYNYVWSSEFGGFKTKVKAADGDIFSSGEENSSVDNLNDENVNFDCERWTVDSSVFVPPSTVEFLDVEAMMGEIEVDANASVDGLDCTLCDSVPDGASKDQCLQALGC